MKLFELLLDKAVLCLVCKDAIGRCMYCGGRGTIGKAEIKPPQPTDEEEPS